MHLFNIRQVFVLRMFAWVSLSFSSRNPPLFHQYGLIPICACLVINEGDSLAFAAKQHPFSREGEENGQEHPHLIKQKLSVCHFSHVYPNYVYVCVCDMWRRRGRLWHGLHLEVREQLCGAGSLLPPFCRFWGSNPFH